MCFFVFECYAMRSLQVSAPSVQHFIRSLQGFTPPPQCSTPSLQGSSTLSMLKPFLKWFSIAPVARLVFIQKNSVANTPRALTTLTIYKLFNSSRRFNTVACFSR